MSFCPKCRSEYINGRPTCADCGTPLVESLDDIIKESFPSGEENEAADREAADFENEIEMNENETGENENSEIEKPERVYAYVSKKEKYKDYISTGYTFLIVGAAGLMAVTLNLLGIIRLFQGSGASSVLFYVVMYAMFILFILVSMNSFKNSGRLKSEADNEDAFLEELNRYITANITKNSFPPAKSGQSEEELYFNRTEIIKNLILEKYPEIGSSLLEQIVDETYDRLFS